MDDSQKSAPRDFDLTQWTLVGAAQSDEASQSIARQALEKLCRAYWYPLYAFVRNRGYSPADAQDLTQSFFVRFIETRGFASAQRDRGRFRNYLLGALKHFLANEWNRSQTKKRGGGVTFVEWDALAPESRYTLEPAQPDNPDLLYDREWALELIARATGKVNAEYRSAGKQVLFDSLKGGLSGDEPPRRETAGRLGISEGAVKAAIHRLRQRYREALRSEIAETVNDQSEIDDEMRHLIAVLRKK